jgi:hypothetical protein
MYLREFIEQLSNLPRYEEGSLHKVSPLLTFKGLQVHFSFVIN